MNSPLWAITSYFNPSGYRRRKLNYRVFREHLRVPLVAVELSFQDRFELDGDDADILIQLRCRNVMWQKERLLNIALRAVPTSCQKVMWIDCDVVCTDPLWPDRTAMALELFPVVQPFSEVCWLARDAWPLTGSHAPGHKWPSVAARVTGSRRSDKAQRFHDRRWLKAAKTGLVWAARRELLEAHGFYDASIVGGADKLMAAAAYGCFHAEAELMSAPQRAHYLDWASEFHESVMRDVGFVDTAICHLWHGERINRQYGRRRRELLRYAFDPLHDIALDVNQCWRWNSDKTELHAFLRSYFDTRLEDG